MSIDVPLKSRVILSLLCVICSFFLNFNLIFLTGVVDFDSEFLEKLVVTASVNADLHYRPPPLNFTLWNINLLILFTCFIFICSVSSWHSQWIIHIDQLMIEGHRLPHIPIFSVRSLVLICVLIVWYCLFIDYLL